jgi:hypothetical protein
MKILRLIKHPFIKLPLLSLLSALRFLRNLRVVFRKVPQHSDDEAIVIRALASIHPMLPRKVARFRAKIIDRVAQRSLPLSGQGSEDADFIFSEMEMQRCVEGLRVNSYYVFNETVPQSLVKSLQQALNSLPAYLRTEDCEKVLFRSGVDKLGLFDFRENDLMSLPALQEYATNPTWHMIAGKYFGAPPVHDEICAWLSFPQPAEFASLNAQMFHSDRRRLSFVKFFIYLTDVTTKNGPHVVVPGSHRERPFSLRSDRRYEDAEIVEFRNAPLELLGKAGTVIAVDTQALHKGKMIEEKSRLILEMQFSTDLLGPSSMALHNEWSEVAKARIRANPRVFQRFQ